MRSPLFKRPALLFGPILAALLFALATPASAHDPIFITEDQTTPETGPYMPDGSISFAIYGSLYEAGQTRGMEFDLRDGDDLYLSLLIPDLEPEINLADAELPVMTLTLPDGSSRDIAPDIRSDFADPFSGTDYVTLYETVEPAAGGRHQLVVTGQAASRFVVAVGTKEEFFTPTERSGDKPTSFPGIAQPLNVWYTTPADGSAPSEAAAEAAEEMDVDVEMIEDALEELNEDEAADDAADATAEALDATDEAAVGDLDADDGSALSWVAPLALVVALLGGAGFYMTRRSQES